MLIAGGGIGGLAAAIALGRSGIKSEVLERSRFTEETGAGIQLGPNATRALAALGVLKLIEPHAFRPEAIVIYDGLSGRKLTAIPLGRSAVSVSNRIPEEVGLESQVSMRCARRE